MVSLPLDSAPAGRPSILGVPVDNLSLSETVERARLAITERRRLQHVALNTAKLVTMRRNPLLWADVTQSDIVSADGMGIVWGGRLLGVRLRERVTGVDLMDALLALSEREGFRPFILGATVEVLEQACVAIMAKHPNLRLAGVHHGYFSETEAPQLVAEIRNHAPDLLFVGMPTPRKEQFLHRYRDELGVPFLMGVGGSIDVIAGVVRRAPGWMQRSGLEWLFRTFQEPRRMWRRYLSTNSAFAWLVLRALVARAIRPRT
jgi:N-acetylglucosaminyldiphosphoundecaprenol N-acetyl-beta-D-mannosaminyltransferase